MTTTATPTLAVPTFVLLADLGTITVPSGYDHATVLGKLNGLFTAPEAAGVKVMERQKVGRFFLRTSSLKDENFANVTDKLAPGDKVRIKAHQVEHKAIPVRPQDRLTHLRSQRSLFLGAQGVGLLLGFEEFNPLLRRLPKGYWYLFVDEKEQLFETEFGHWVPYLVAMEHEKSTFEVNLSRYNGAFNEKAVVLSFIKE